ncbi:DUF2309 domain-containing protein [Halobaculum sp. MBLA0143]|uniref:DUF2309 domain-containing protein n=1 Tax=Halobaculum sp. MBLA0143 TaxID=3079933 RepID=UPI0035237305
MSTETTVRESLEHAAESVGAAWPLHSFVTANPLAGFEDRPFWEAVREGERLFGARGYPSAEVLRRAWETDRIDPEVLSATLADHGYDDTPPERLLDRVETGETAETTETNQSGTTETETPEARMEGVLTKWLAAFFDQGQADWPMPNREDGLYAAVRAVVRHDRHVPNRSEVAEFPDDPVAAVENVLADWPSEQWESIFEYHLAGLPGWTGFVKHRVEAGDDWQSAYPATLTGYLAVRLVLADLFDAPIAPPEGTHTTDSDETPDEGAVPLPEIWLTAWETTYREELVGAVADAGRSQQSDHDGHGTDDGDSDRPAAQLVFCIDTRSEIVRRHVERAGPYETHGYAGFFGVPMRYEGYDAEVTVDACPPILDAQHRIAEQPTDESDPRRSDYEFWSRLRQSGSELLHTLKTNPGTVFGFVENTGGGYGLALAARTLLPARVYDALAATDDHVPDAHEFCAPTVDHEPGAPGELPQGLTHEEKVEYAATAFELMGWEAFARVVAFVGHAGQTANNPFESSLDCGACAGNPGGPSARLLAAICNEDAVREALRQRGHEIPHDTVFVAGEHNTTTDEITLYDGGVPESHAADLERLREDLAEARAGAAAERAADVGAAPASGVRETERRATDWAETRPEWGLAGNAAFVIGRRALTADLDLGGRSFLHSYDPATDPDGDALEAILTGPMVVTQWINCQYYFATVDNAAYGSGSKITQNPVGNVGVYQGNGGDLMTGLPLQSVLAADDEPYHQPLRLSVVVEAPVDRVTEILAAHDHLTDLLDNGWLSLTVVDPEREYRAFHYDGGLAWRAVRPAESGEATGPLLTADSADED